MKSPNKNFFTLVELMFAVGILVILIGISWVFSKGAFDGVNRTQIKGELLMLKAAVEAYKVDHGVYPYADSGSDFSGDLNFVEYLSKVKPNDNYSGSKRPMYERMKELNLSNKDTFDNTANPGQSTARDPYDQAYQYVLELNGPGSLDDRFYIYSLAKNASSADDDLRSDQLNKK